MYSCIFFVVTLSARQINGLVWHADNYYGTYRHSRVEKQNIDRAVVDNKLCK